MITPMKKILLLFITLCFFCATATAADLLEVYQQALISDPIYQQAIAQRLSTKEGVPISLSSILPNIALAAQPSVTRFNNTGSLVTIDPGTGLPLSAPNFTQRAYTLTLSATQTIFDFGKFFTVAGQLALSKSADATLNAALQDLMIRVANAYFAVLRDEDNLSYNEASKLAYAKQLDQVKQQYKVGIKTITDLYTAQAAYDSAVAAYIGAQNTLDNDRENLRVITGKYYPKLATLSENFPLITPQPANIEEWVHIAQAQNWSIKAAQYNVENTKQIVRQKFSGHLPTVDVEADFGRQYTNNITQTTSLVDTTGPGTQNSQGVMLNINVPLFSGGGVIAETNQASYNYQIAQQQLEQTLRNTLNITRQSYLGILSGISQIKADKQAIKSNISSLQGMEESYRVGTETLVDVLNQQEKLFQAQTAYATDRYTYVNNLLALKQAAGTLSFDDLRAINEWLLNQRRTQAYTTVKKR
jgi:outer membrane protein